MQKIMICLGRPENTERNAWNSKVDQFLRSHETQFHGCGYALVDDAVSPAFLLEMRNTQHPKDAVLTLWADNPYELSGFFSALRKLATYQAYVVMESAAIPAQFELGRVTGMCQLAFIKKHENQSRQDWLEAWLGNHTAVAIDTQSNFAYRQNLVAFSLPLDDEKLPPWPLMDAIVEENFPVIAMTSREAFFDAEGDPEKFERHQQIMISSCLKFIDFDAFDCVPMSQYVVKVF